MNLLKIVLAITLLTSAMVYAMFGKNSDALLEEILFEFKKITSHLKKIEKKLNNKPATSITK